MFLRQLLAGFVQREMRGRVFGALQEAAQGAVGGEALSGAGQGSAEPELPPHVVILFALGIEAAGPLAALTAAKQVRGKHLRGQIGTWANHRVLVAQVGATGAAPAAQAAEEIITAAAPTWLISAGFAGGLHDELRRGHMLLVERVGQENGPDLDVGITVDAASARSSPGLHVGKLVTVDRLIRTSAEKRELAAQHQALACDMETYAIAQACRQSKTRFLAARVISDAVDDELAPEVEWLMQQKSWAGQLGAAAGALWRRPAVAQELWRLQEEAHKSSTRLARFLAGMLAQLPAG